MQAPTVCSSRGSEDAGEGGPHLVGDVALAHALAAHVLPACEDAHLQARQQRALRVKYGMLGVRCWFMQR